MTAAGAVASGRRRNLTVALAGAAVVALLAGVGILLGNLDDESTINSSGPGSQNGLPAGAGQSTGTRGQVSTKPGGQKSSPRAPGRSSAPAAGAPSSGAANTKPTAPVGADPDTSTAPSGTNPHANPVPLCGDGYEVIDSRQLKTSAGELRGTVHVLFRAAGSMNCVVTIKADTLDEKTSMSATLQVKGDGKTHTNKGTFQYYAGPVSAAAPATCIKWGGAIGGMSYESDWSHCN